MRKVSVRMKLSVIIIMFLAIGFILLNRVSIGILQEEVLTQIQTEDAKLADAFAAQVAEKLELENYLEEIQELMDEINAHKAYNYVLYMEQDDKGDVIAVAHANHDRIGIVLEDEGSVLATKEGKAYCGFHTDAVTGLRTLDVLSPVYDQQGNQRGTFNIGVPVDEATMNEITSQAILKLTMLSVIIAIVLVLFLVIVVNVLVGKPLGNLRKILGALTDGDLAVRFHAGALNFGDELHFVEKDMNRLADKLKEIVETTQQYSHKLESDTKHFSQAARVTNEGVANISQAMNDVANGAAEQAGNTNVAMEKIQELAEALEAITGKIDDLNVSAREMQELSGASRDVLNSLVKVNADTKDSINKMVVQSNATLQEIEEINSIVEAIDEIAGQTNLLSLNASIEAARAGEAGRGFMVVASGIGNLAKSSSDSAKQISVIIERVKEMIERSAKLSFALEESASKQMEKLQDTEKTMVSVIEGVEGIANSTEQIHGEVGTLNRVKVDMGDTIQNLSAISQENAAAAQETAAFATMMQSNVGQIEKASEEINVIAVDLDKTINYFHEGERD